MDRETIVKLADENGLWDYFDLLEGNSVGLLMLERFAKQVAEHEREACAKECEHTAVRMGSEWMAHHCAAAIRARGET